MALTAPRGRVVNSRAAEGLRAPGLTWIVKGELVWFPSGPCNLAVEAPIPGMMVWNKPVQRYQRGASPGVVLCKSEGPR